MVIVRVAVGEKVGGLVLVHVAEGDVDTDGDGDGDGDAENRERRETMARLEMQTSGWR